jgi:hypothetical protein
MRICRLYANRVMVKPLGASSRQKALAGAGIETGLVAIARARVTSTPLMALALLELQLV